MKRFLFSIAFVAVIGSARGQDLGELQEQAIKAAVAKVAPTVVAIETVGGTDVIIAGPQGQRIRKGSGPTTGLIVSADGYVITSAFNFANKPTEIFVAVPGKKGRFVAKVMATDQTRMLTLLHLLNFNDKDLPIPTAFPKKDVQVGMTTLAIGRTLALNVDDVPSVSQGIASAISRIWGKAVQTDAKVSPTNYGGPLIDLTGRVIGVLVPASPRAENETAGFEWYDSGIGFAMPLEDIYRVLPRMKAGKDLKKGLLGVTMKSNDQYSDEPIVGTIAPGSAAESVGLKPGDRVLEIDGKAVNNYAQVLHQLGSKYEGDSVALKYQRGKDTLEIKEAKLGSAMAAFNRPFLGILPMRDDPEPGIAVRYVFRKSPAAEAGLKEGDRITKIGPNEAGLQPIAGREQLSGMIATLRPGTEIALEIIPRGTKETKKLTVKLGDFNDAVPEDLPKESSFEKALQPKKTLPGPGPKPDPMPKKDDKKDAKEDKKEEKKDDKEKPKAPTGLMKRANAARDRNYWIYVPENYDPNISFGVVIWLHPVNKNKERDIEGIKNKWDDYCFDHKLIMVMPVSENDTGWVANEMEFVSEAVRAVTTGYTVDRRRIVAHGMGVGGQMAFYMGFAARDLIRGVATVGAVLTANPKERLANQPLSFFIVVGEKDPILDAVKESESKLKEYRYPVQLRELKEKGHDYFDLDTEKTLKELVRWIDSLDRL